MIEHLLTDAQVWFVVGLRDNPQRAAYRVAEVLVGLGKTMVPIHPAAQQVHGCEGFPTITEAAQVLGPPDVVDVFLRPALVAPIVDEAISAAARAVWLQLGVIDQPSADRALAAGLDVVMDRCPAIEWPRLRR